MRMPGDRPTLYLVVSTKWSQESLISQAFLNYFLFRGIVTQGRLGGQRINAIVCGYYFCLIYSHRLLCRSCRYLLPRRNCVGPIKNTLTWLYGVFEIIS